MGMVKGMWSAAFTPLQRPNIDALKQNQRGSQSHVEAG
jgi:hypothetical protein